MTPTLHGRDEPRGLDYPSLQTISGRFGRLFPELHGLHVPLHTLQALAEEMHDPPPPEPSTAGWGTPSPPPPDERDNDAIPAAYTYLGQFIDHDVTFDPLSRLERSARPEELSNFRVPRLDLDSVYGGGPAVSPHLYRRDQSGCLLIDAPNGIEDLPRNVEGVALAGDPRNDENQIVSQLHLAVIKFHNAQIDALGNFEDARQATQWHYQWVTVHDFLRRLVGEELVHEILSVGPAFFRWPYQVFMPVEFAAATYRFGHSQVRPSYRLRRDGALLPVFGEEGQDLRGGRALTPERRIEWGLLAPFENPPTPSRKVDLHISEPLFHLFGTGAEAPAGETALPLRNLRRGIVLGLPSGQAVVRHLTSVLGHLPDRIPVSAVPDDQLDLSRHGWRGEMPLWFYTLVEAQTLSEGRRLGPMASRIVAEVLIGLLEGDPTSYLARSPGWQPAEDPANFTLSRFLEKAGVTI